MGNFRYPEPIRALLSNSLSFWDWMCRVDGSDIASRSQCMRRYFQNSCFNLKYYCKKRMTKSGFYVSLAPRQALDRLDHIPSYLDPEPKGACGIML